MCKLCQRWPCDPRCPNAPEPPALFICANCNDSIIAGDEYVTFGEKHYHFECFEDSAVGLMLNEYGAVKGIAEDDG